MDSITLTALLPEEGLAADTIQMYKARQTVSSDGQTSRSPLRKLHSISVN
jgi:hypothetical protein